MKFFCAPLSLELATAVLLRKKRHQLKDSPLFAALIGITLSIVPLVLVLEVSDSMISGILNRYIETFYSHIVLRFPERPEKTEMDRLEERIEELPAVKISYKERKGAALLIVGAARSAVQVRALEDRAFQKDQGFRQYLKVLAGSSELALGSILLASDVAFKLQVSVGDEVALLTGAQFGQNQQLRPKIQKFVVLGIVSTGYQELDRLWAFISFQDAQSFFHHSNSEELLHIKICDAFDEPLLEKTVNQVQNIVGSRVAQIRTWNMQVSGLNDTYRFTKLILTYIMYLIVAVGTINIASSMVLLVLENSSEIAIMKTFGAHKSLIRNTYIWVSILVSVIAIFYGTAIGVLISYFINEIIAFINWLLQLVSHHFFHDKQNLNILNKSYYLEHIPVQIQVLPLVWVAAFVLAMTFLCSIVPALKAAEMLPLAILRQNRN